MLVTVGPSRWRSWCSRLWREGGGGEVRKGWGRDEGEGEEEMVEEKEVNKGREEVR